MKRRSLLASVLALVGIRPKAKAKPREINYTARYGACVMDPDAVVNVPVKPSDQIEDACLDIYQRNLDLIAEQHIKILTPDSPEGGWFSFNPEK